MLDDIGFNEQFYTFAGAQEEVKVEEEEAEHAVADEEAQTSEDGERTRTFRW